MDEDAGSERRLRKSQSPNVRAWQCSGLRDLASRASPEALFNGDGGDQAPKLPEEGCPGCKPSPDFHFTFPRLG